MTGGPLLVIAAGGTGGHMFPAQALSEAMLRRGWRVKLSTDDRGARYSSGFADAVEREVISSATFARGGVAAKLAVPFRIFAGVAKAAWTMWRDRPAAVAGFGGYPAIPAMAGAWLLRLPRMIHEQNGVLGRVNQLFARRVAAVACGTWPTELPQGAKAVYTGNPVRAAIAERAGAAYIPPGDYPMSLLVFGGSQGARVLSDVVPAAVAALPDSLKQRLRVAQQAREEDVERVEAAYAQAGIDAEILTFFNDMPKRLSEAQLVISRAGASSVADIAAIGRPSILVPLASAIRDEQTANARTLVEAEAAVLVPERVLSPTRLAEQIELVLSHRKAAFQMAQAAFSVGRPDAAERLADLVEALAEGRPLAQEETAE